MDTKPRGSNVKKCGNIKGIPITVAVLKANLRKPIVKCRGTGNSSQNQTCPNNTEAEIDWNIEKNTRGDLVLLDLK